MKTAVNLPQAKYLLETGCVVLVTSWAAGKSNVMTCSWQTPVAGGQHCSLILSIGEGHYTYELISQNPELVVNIPHVDLLRAVQIAGTASGRVVDKFRDAHLTCVPAKMVKPPVIDECKAHLECRVSQSIALGVERILLCEVVYAEAERDVFNGAWVPESGRTLHHLGGGAFGVLERSVRDDSGGKD